MRPAGGLLRFIMLLFGRELAERERGFVSAKLTLFNPAEFLRGRIAT